MMLVIVTFKQAVGGGSNVRRYKDVVSCAMTSAGIIVVVSCHGAETAINHPAELIEHVQQRWM